ncbi:MAG: hypothetical protein JRN06_03130 [Nitrososphaerota archaeon]|nr:hypothetical protein [Nitrososphaerota archaeon]
MHSHLPHDGDPRPHGAFVRFLEPVAYMPPLLDPGSAARAAFATLRYHNTKRTWRCFGGAAACGVIFLLLIAYVFFIIYATSEACLGRTTGDTA